MEEKKLSSSITTKTVDVQEDGVLELVVNSGGADRVDEILDLNGLDVTKYLQNPVVGWGHNYDHPAIGKTIKLWRDETTGFLKALVKFANYDFAKLIYELYRDGFMTAWSIGFIPKEAEENSDGSLTFTKSEMLEYSAVFVGADPKALTQAKKLGGNNFVKALNGEIAIKDFKLGVKEKAIEAVVEKEGRVLSKSNRNKVQNAVDALNAILEADIKEGAKSADNTELEVPLETAEKAIIGIRRLVYSNQVDQTAIKKQAQVLDKSAEEIIRQTKQAIEGKAKTVNKIIYKKG